MTCVLCTATSFFVFCNPVLSAVALLCQGATTCVPMSRQKREEKELAKERDAKRKSCDGTGCHESRERDGKRRQRQEKDMPTERDVKDKPCQEKVALGECRRKGVTSERAVKRKRCGKEISRDTDIKVMEK